MQMNAMQLSPLLVGMLMSLFMHQGLQLPYPAPPAVAVPAHKLPHPGPLSGPLAPNHELARADKLFAGVRQPETPVTLPDGSVYVGSADGYVMRGNLAHPGRFEAVAHTGGVPLGLAWHPDGYLVVCDAISGLVAVDPSTGAVTLLSARLSNSSLPRGEADLLFADGVDVSRRSGAIYFTDASRIFPTRSLRGEYDVLAASVNTLLQGAPTGRLLAYHPSTRDTKLLAAGIWFSNGVALSDDESYVVVAETFGMRLLRHWLAGPKAGQTEVFTDGLPGFPDGVSRSPDGRSFWVAIISTPPKVALLLPHSRLLRWLMAWLPKALHPAPVKYGLVLQVDAATGQVLRSLHDPSGAHCHTLTSAIQVGNKLFMGSIGQDHICMVDL